ncbi:AAA family ATPase [Nannocystaceae bacterium ST9]
MLLDARGTDLLTRTTALSDRLTVLSGNLELDRGQRELARAWRDRLGLAHRRASSRLSVAFVAQVGRGKSSLIAGAAGLRVSQDDSPKKWSVLPVGDGRTTLSETRICFEDRDDIQIEVDPIPLGELQIELRLFARDLWTANTEATAASKSSGSAGEELYTLLRNWLVPGVEKPRSVLAELARAASDAENLEATLWSRLDLDVRTQPFSRCYSNDPKGLTELKGQLKALMTGDLPDAPAPRMVRIRQPMIEIGQFIDTIIDTRGIDSVAEVGGRRDILDLMAAPDTLLVVCSEFGSAPDEVSRSVIETIQELSGQASIFDPLRLVIIDDREIDDDPGEQAQRIQERDERISQCRDLLRRAGLQLDERSVLAIDVRREADELRAALADLAIQAHQGRVDAWEQVLDDAHEAISSLSDQGFAAQARELELRMWWVWDAALTNADVKNVDGLTGLAQAIEARANIQHWSHLNAAIRRRGRYNQLDLAALGALITAGAAGAISHLYALAKTMSFAHGAAASLDPRLAKHLALRVQQLTEAVNSHRIDFLNAWRQVLADYFASPESNDLWSWCESRWGLGSGYTQAVAERFRQQAARANLELGSLPVEIETRLPKRPDLFSLRKVRLQNYRGVTQRSIDIAETTTVLVGDNGLGKTCWLEAIAAGVGAILPGMGAGPPPELCKDDVRQVIRELAGVPDRQYQFPMELEIEATVQGHLLPWTRRIESPSHETAVTEGEAMEVMARQIGEEVRAHAIRQLPVLAYYGTQRLWPPAIEPGDRREVGSRLDGYRDCLKAASTHRDMMEWVRHFTMVGLQRKNPVVQLQAIERAVVACVEGAEYFGYDLALQDLTVTLRDGQVFAFRMLSDGYRNIVAMVADIAWRASVLNPQLGDRAASLAEGVVLIDEIDLHLHPKWQRRVLADLRRAFPRLQFITTTHSPFIIQSLEPGQLVNLDPDAEDAPYANESPEDIAEHIMGVDVPQRSERRRKEFEAAKRYYDLLDQVPAADEAELARLKAELDEIVEPYVENQALVAFLERKRALAEAKR